MDRADLLSPVEGPVLSDVEGCAVCGLDPCGCGIELAEFLANDDTLPLLSPSTPPAAPLRMNSVEGPPAGAVAHAAFVPDEGPVLSHAEGPSDRLAAWRHPAFAAWIDRRDALEAKHGERAVTHAGRPAAAIARDLKERACALVDRLAAREPDAAAALATIATIGALALALHEKLAAEAEAA